MTSNNPRRAAALAALLLLTTKPPAMAEDREPIVLTDAARRLHGAALVIDGHNDMPWEVRTQGDSSFDRIDISQPQPTLHTDIPRLREGGVGAQFWSVWAPVWTARRGAALTTTLEQIALVKQMIRRYPDHFTLALTADDIDRARGQGKIASLIGVEGGHCIENSLSVLNQLYEEGARYMTLTHSDSLDWADSATDKERSGGLSPFGEQVVREMNRMGMMVDLSHVSADTMHQAMRVSDAPVIFSHSSARGVADHPRNVPDDVLARLPEEGGVVMVNYFSAFVVPDSASINKERLAKQRELEARYGDDQDAIRRELDRWAKDKPSPRGTIHDVLDHIDHIARVAGIEHVGLGSDYDGVSMLPEQLEDVSTYPYITQGLLDRGYSEEEVRGVLGENLMRVFRAVERVAEETDQR
ncbi:dipeptidase [Botrimarina sp.]|uniref:dipeptidase n=1 Tax=Botrimarina sp. TaxID=2795802 RepID=UPI0032ED25E4